MKILILNGPNLNLLGQRETAVYGPQSLMDLEAGLRRYAQQIGVEVECQQSNQEGHLIDALHRARNRFQGVVFNPAGYAHTSVALRDAIAAIPIPVVEVHISNIYAREEFRHKSVTGAACAGVITGLGFAGYELAMSAIMRLQRQPGDAIQPAAAGPEAVRAERAMERPVDRTLDRPGDRTAERPLDRSDRTDRSDRPDRSEKAEGPARAERPEGPARPDRPGERGVERISETDADREGKRRRRGRRGGRGRRREGDGPPRREGAEGPATEGNRSDPAEITARYANLKGAVVRRGLDVLAEDEAGDEMPPQSAPGGSVTFLDEPAGDDRPQERAGAHDSDESPLVIPAGVSHARESAHSHSHHAPHDRHEQQGPHERHEQAAPEETLKLESEAPAGEKPSEAPAATPGAAAAPEAEAKPARKPPARRRATGTPARRGATGAARRTSSRTTKKDVEDDEE